MRGIRYSFISWMGRGAFWPSGIVSQWADQGQRPPGHQERWWPITVGSCRPKICLPRIII